MIRMSGHDRLYAVPAKFQSVVGSSVTAWDLLDISKSGNEASGWADRVLNAVVARLEGAMSDLCPTGDCDDLRYYGIPSADNEDILVELVRSADDNSYEHLTASGWEPFHPDKDTDAISLTDAVAADVSTAILAGASGVALRYALPIAWLPPSNDEMAVPLTAAVAAASPEWRNYAIVDDLDPGAVLNLIRLASGPRLESYASGEWKEDEALLNDLRGITPPMLVELDEALLASVKGQIDSGADADSGHYPDPVTAAVSLDPRAEKLRRYWSIGGKGGLKIRWGMPGDWRRCRKYLSKYMGPRAKGYCQNLHKRNTGMYTGSKLNASATWPRKSTEAAIAASIKAGGWFADTGKVSDMKDGIYTEVVADDVEMFSALTAGAFPVSPPEEWFDNPNLEGPTPLTVEASGRVYGHIASFDVAHIGLPGRVHAPRSASGYAFFHTGELVTASGASVPVGQITLTGGHAPLSADAGQAVAHYDNTASAVMDVHVGEDKYGIWAAGAIRPDVTQEQLRAIRAAAPSGDWRPINGNLELVAICQVNVPGFPIARARVASGAVMALVAAGARPLAEQMFASAANRALADKVASLEAALIASGVMVVDAADAIEEATIVSGDGTIEATQIEGEVTTEPDVVEVEEVDTEVPVEEAEGEPESEPEPMESRFEAIRKQISEKRRAELRARVAGA